MAANDRGEAAADRLSLSGCGLGVQGLLEVFSDLKDDNVILDIDLSGNLTEADTAHEQYPAMLQSMLAALSVNDTLLTFRYGDNWLGPGDLELLLVPLRRREWVRLDLSSARLLGPTRRVFRYTSSKFLLAAVLLSRR